MTQLTRVKLAHSGGVLPSTFTKIKGKQRIPFSFFSKLKIEPGTLELAIINFNWTLFVRLILGLRHTHPRGEYPALNIPTPCGKTHTCENITFPQLCLTAVKRNHVLANSKYSTSIPSVTFRYASIF